MLRIQILLMFVLCTFSFSAFAVDKKEFRVADYGAVGDGKTDDGTAIRKAVADAVKAGEGSKVVFEKKSYKLAQYKGGTFHISIKNASGITLEGNGAEIINNPFNSIIEIVDCKNVTMRGFSFDCNPLPFTQGDVTKVDEEKGVFYLKIHKGYENPVKVFRDLGKKPNWGWGVCVDPNERKRKPEAVMHMFIKKITEESKRKKLVKIELADNAKKFIHEIAKNDRFTLPLKYGGSGVNILVSRSADIHLEDYTIYGAKYGMNHGLFDNHGRVYVKRVKITFKPETNRLVSSWKDGFHCKHNAIGPVFEDCMIEGIFDDSINISVCPYWVKKDLGNNRYLIGEVQYSPRVGNELMAYTPNPNSVTYNFKVLKVEPQEAPNGQRGKFNIITLNKPIPNVKLHKGNNLFPGGVDKLKITGLYNIDASGKDYIIRNNTFKAQRRHAILARGSGGLIEGNMIDGVGGSGVNLGNEIGSFYEGPLVSNVIIRNNTFKDTFFNSINIYSKGKGTSVKNITVVNNTISGWYDNPRDKGPAAAISVSNIDGGVIKGNTITPGKADISRSVPIRINGSKDVKVIDNKITTRVKNEVKSNNSTNIELKNNKVQLIEK